MQNNPTNFDNDQIPISTPPKKVLEGFNNELRHYITNGARLERKLSNTHSEDIGFGMEFVE